MDQGSQSAAFATSGFWMSRLSQTTQRADVAEISLLVQRTLGGDNAAFEQLIVRYERRVFSLAMKLLASTEDAQDAAQEVFLRVFKYIHRFDVQKPLEPWLLQMTVNVCRNIGRDRQRRWMTFPTTVEPDMAIVSEARDPLAGLNEEQERELLWKALDTLPEKERLAVILRDIDGRKTSEVAEILGSTETTVRSQVSRARVRMKEALDQLLGARP
jgi:RNA polymerase sigma-70 factor (ECF subfamily)